MFPSATIPHGAASDRLRVYEKFEIEIVVGLISGGEGRWMVS